LLAEAGADANAARDLYFALSGAKARFEPSALRDGGRIDALAAALPPRSRAVVTTYQELLRERHALDFGDLVLEVRAALHLHPDLQRRWMDRYDFVQVDEVQDTHASEYDVVRFLARRHGNLALIGDLAQTIYEWRGSKPNRLLRRFKEDFDPALYHLADNYRATRMLLAAAAGLMGGENGRYALSRPAPGCAEGSRILLHGAADEEGEGDWIAARIRADTTGDPNLPLHRCAVLVRTNRRAQVISARLRAAGIPHVTVEEYEFFRRQEIKDAIAYLRLLVTPNDTGALHRVLLRPPRGIGASTLHRLVHEGAACALRLTDLVNTETYRHGDPYIPLLDAWHHGAVVVFDVETTGLDPEHDEIVELAALRLQAGSEPVRFHAFLRNTIPVGDAEAIHGWSDAFLAEHGADAREGLTAFAAFCAGAVLAGHNIGYDQAICRSHATRLGLPAPTPASIRGTSRSVAWTTCPITGWRPSQRTCTWPANPPTRPAMTWTQPPICSHRCSPCSKNTRRNDRPWSPPPRTASSPWPATWRNGARPCPPTALPTCSHTFSISPASAPITPANTNSGASDTSRNSSICSARLRTTTKVT
jgi:DNA helicase-2/ATP-dependent DNA helicase PcrA